MAELILQAQKALYSDDMEEYTRVQAKIREEILKEEIIL